MRRTYVVEYLDGGNWFPAEDGEFKKLKDAREGIRNLRLHAESIMDEGEEDDSEYRIVCKK
jgi:hypothetical protein